MFLFLLFFSGILYIVMSLGKRLINFLVELVYGVMILTWTNIYGVAIFSTAFYVLLRGIFYSFCILLQESVYGVYILLAAPFMALQTLIENVPLGRTVFLNEPLLEQRYYSTSS